MSLNLYNDKSISAPKGFGMDISIQRADDLDNMAIEDIHNRLAKGNEVNALDLACGQGGQAIRMAQAGADTVAVDHTDLSGQWSSLADANNVSIHFIAQDLSEYLTTTSMRFDVVSFQRTLHYFNYQDAVNVLSLIQNVMKPGGKLYVSASGFLSELGDGYAARHAPLDQRMDYLAKDMREKHSIHHPVCLYHPGDLHKALTVSGWVVDTVFSSPFKNVKAIAEPSKDSSL